MMSDPFALTIDEQVKMLEKQLENFDTLMEKMAYLNGFLKDAPDIDQRARDLVMHNIMKDMPK